MFCEKCGTQIPDECLCCPRCGKRVTESNSLFFAAGDFENLSASYDGKADDAFATAGVAPSFDRNAVKEGCGSASGNPWSAAGDLDAANTRIAGDAFSAEDSWNTARDSEAADSWSTAGDLETRNAGNGAESLGTAVPHIEARNSQWRCPEQLPEKTAPKSAGKRAAAQDGSDAPRAAVKEKPVPSEKSAPSGIKVGKKRKWGLLVSAAVLVLALLGGGAFGAMHFFGDRAAQEQTELLSVSAVADYLADNAAAYGYENALSELTEKTTNTVDGDTYYRLQQNYQGIPVFGRTAVYAVDEAGNRIAFTENVQDISSTISVTPAVSEEQAQRAVTEYANSYLASASDQADLLWGLSEEDLCIYTLGDTPDCLAYDTYMCYGAEIYHVVLSATTGDVLLCEPTKLYEEHPVEASGKDTDKNEVQFQAYKRDENDYIMWDTERNLIVYDANNEIVKYNFTAAADATREVCRYVFEDHEWYDTDGNDIGPSLVVDTDTLKWDFSTEENKKGVAVCGSTTTIWDNPEAVTVMSRAEQTYDFYQRILHRSGYDNNNAELTIVVKDKAVKDYGAWSMSPCPGKGFSVLSFYKKMQIDIIAHEYTHSVERSESGLLAQGESGAIGEALSDIFGEIVEDWADGKMDGSCDWIHSASRCIKDPSKSSNPSIYLGEFWETTEVTDEEEDNDNGHVHNNSTVISHAAYLMWNGIDGDSSKKLSTEQLAKVWYRAMLMMPSDCDFHECCRVVELAAKLVDLTAPQIACVSEAFDIVGITDTAENAADYTIAVGATMSVIGNNGEPYDNYSYQVNGTLSEYVTDGDRTFSKTYTVFSAEAQKLELQEGSYTIRLIDNVGAQQPITLTVRVSRDATEKELILYTNFMGEETRQPTEYVTEAYSAQKSYQNFDGTSATAEYRIPQINLESDEIRQLNRKIYESYYDDIQSAFEDIQSYGYPSHLLSMQYDWYVNGDVLSLVIECGYQDYGESYEVYNFSISKAKQIDNAEVIGASSFTMTQYREKAKQALASRYLEHTYPDAYNAMDASGRELWIDRYNETISAANLDATIPFLNEKGQLCIIGNVYSLAGADYYPYPLNLEAFTLSPYYGEDFTTGEAGKITHAIHISEEEAYDMACEYWSFTEGAVDEESGLALYLVYDGLLEESDGNHYYAFRLRWWVTENNMMSTVDYLYINAETGECSYAI